MSKTRRNMNVGPIGERPAHPYKGDIEPLFIPNAINSHFQSVADRKTNSKKLKPEQAIAYEFGEKLKNLRAIK